MNSYKDIRPSPLAGRWYPADPIHLADSIDGYIKQAQIPDIPGEVTAVISPHAGHLYSGQVAGYAFKTLQGSQIDLVVILSPFHHPHTDPILTSGHDAYQTPLGEVPVDYDSQKWVAAALQERSEVSLTRIRNDKEHAVEILLPFFQRVFQDGFQLLPIMVNDQSPTLMYSLGSILSDLAESRDALLVASTDLSHFHTAQEARKLDQTIIDHIKALDPEGLYQAQHTGSGSACGLGPLASIIWAAIQGGPVRSQILNYAHSGNITGDNASVVGYTSGVLIRD